MGFTGFRGFWVNGDVFVLGLIQAPLKEATSWCFPDWLQVATATLFAGTSSALSRPPLAGVPIAGTRGLSCS